MNLSDMSLIRKLFLPDSWVLNKLRILTRYAKRRKYRGHIDFHRLLL